MKIFEVGGLPPVGELSDGARDKQQALEDKFGYQFVRVCANPEDGTYTAFVCINVVDICHAIRFADIEPACSVIDRFLDRFDEMMRKK